MNQTFGPWTTGMQSGHRAELSAFWQRRMRALAQTSGHRVHLSRREFLGLGAAGALAVALPTLERAAVSAEDPAATSDAAAKRTPGRIFIRLTLPDEEPDGPPGFRGYAAVDPEMGRYEPLGISEGHSLRVSPDGQTVAYAHEEALWTN
ncbi:MAG: hypothetical protein ACREJB_07595, partial [Planctomycetaceae bacterium]